MSDKLERVREQVRQQPIEASSERDDLAVVLPRHEREHGLRVSGGVEGFARGGVAGAA